MQKPMAVIRVNEAEYEYLMERMRTTKNRSIASTLAEIIRAERTRTPGQIYTMSCNDSFFLQLIEPEDKALITSLNTWAGKIIDRTPSRGLAESIIARMKAREEIH